VNARICVGVMLLDFSDLLQVLLLTF